MLNSNLQPLISIIIPTHNRAYVLADAIDSVLAQSYSNWELLIVDDSSTDNTAEIMNGFQDNPKIRYLISDSSCRGASPTRNVGIKNAQGEYIAFLDSDDLYYPDALELMLKPLLENSSKMAVQAFFRSMDMETNKYIRTQGVDLVPGENGSFQLPYNLPWDWLTILDQRFPCMLGSSLFRRKVFEELGLLREDLTHLEDYELFLRLFLKDQQCLLPIPFYVLKARHQKISLSRNVSQTDNAIKCYIKVLEEAFQHKNLPECAQKIKPFVLSSAFRKIARMHLNNGNSKNARRIAQRAWSHSAISVQVWLKTLLALYAQSYLPAGFYNKLADLNRTLNLKLAYLAKNRIVIM